DGRATVLVLAANPGGAPGPGLEQAARLVRKALARAGPARGVLVRSATAPRLPDLRRGLGAGPARGGHLARGGGAAEGVLADEDGQPPPARPGALAVLSQLASPAVDCVILEAASARARHAPSAGTSATWWGPRAARAGPRRQSSPRPSTRPSAPGRPRRRPS